MPSYVASSISPCGESDSELDKMLNFWARIIQTPLATGWSTAEWVGYANGRARVEYLVLLRAAGMSGSPLGEGEESSCLDFRACFP